MKALFLASLTGALVAFGSSGCIAQTASSDDPSTESSDEGPKPPANGLSEQGLSSNGSKPSGSPIAPIPSPWQPPNPTNASQADPTDETSGSGSSPVPSPWMTPSVAGQTSASAGSAEAEQPLEPSKTSKTPTQ